MTKVMEWLKARAPGFANLSDEEVNAITEFSLLWSLFESRILSRNASATALCSVVEAWTNEDGFDPGLFDEEIDYFKQRYHPGDDFSDHFLGLRLQRRDQEPMVRRVLEGADVEPRHRLSAALIIVYRYRNNLFHGEKWEYELADQLANFNAANAILAKALERYGSLG